MTNIPSEISMFQFNIVKKTLENKLQSDFKSKQNVDSKLKIPYDSCEYQLYVQNMFCSILPYMHVCGELGLFVRMAHNEMSKIKLFECSFHTAKSVSAFESLTMSVSEWAYVCELLIHPYIHRSFVRLFILDFSFSMIIDKLRSTTESIIQEKSSVWWCKNEKNLKVIISTIVD